MNTLQLKIPNNHTIIPEGLAVPSPEVGAPPFLQAFEDLIRIFELSSC